MPRGPLVRSVAALAALAAAATVYAQQIWVGGGRNSRMSPRFAKVEDFDGGFLYCRGYYESRWREQSGSGWRTDYPGADNNFSVRLAELTRVPVKFDPNRQPHHVVVPLTDQTLYRCPILFMEDIGTADFSAEEVQRLREYFLKGGFLWVDDSWGSYAWANWVGQIGRILPPGEFPIIDIPVTHPIMRTLYHVTEIPQVPAISFWRGSRGATSERGPDSAEVYFKGIQDARQRLMVLMTHNTDIADTWEREGEFPREYFDLFSPRGYAIGVNVVLYAMTH
ncbi:MAG: hypothetical protein A3H97_01585 [Acidobacteria bacterium RIFCSPLOWO2_02_FULL_65_29]|nr:MAG: hypothetical protein A3H97_01585 [Acidobacteria bacterium RIFCSPLOWO2_02_FULL_65_29]